MDDSLIAPGCSLECFYDIIVTNDDIDTRQSNDYMKQESVRAVMPKY